MILHPSFNPDEVPFANWRIVLGGHDSLLSASLFMFADGTWWRMCDTGYGITVKDAVSSIESKLRNEEGTCAPSFLHEVTCAFFYEWKGIDPHAIWK